VSQPSTVDSLIGTALDGGAASLKPVSKSFWGYGGVVRAPDGAIWKVATSSKKDTGPATRQIDDIVLLLGVADVKASKRFYVDRGLDVDKSFGSKYVQFEAPASRIKLALYGRRALAKDAGVAPEAADRTGSRSPAMPAASWTRTSWRGRPPPLGPPPSRVQINPSRAKEASMSPTKTTKFTAEERAAMKERVRELKAEAQKADAEQDLLAKIAEMKGPDRAIAKRLHVLIKATAPELEPRTWYGMPAYARDGKVVCFFQSAQKFKSRYAMLGFSDRANLDDGEIWPVYYAVDELSASGEARIAELVKKAVG
jgi:uncharacterized protein YdhG (YjbR/CyaY superfamily)